jgi:multiple sugar transport system substrate-binding protein
MMAMAASRRLACGLKGVHAFMSFLTLAANLGDPCAQEKGRPRVGRGIARTVLAMLRELAAACPPEALDWNSIALQDAMCARNDLAYCPFVYGFATYAEADRTPRLAYADIPDAGGRRPVGSTIGGAGLGVSAQSKHAEAAEAFAAFMARSDTQCAVVARHHGQPAHRDAWHDAEIDRLFGGFFSGTRRTIEASAIRPRYAGYMDLQAKAGPLIEAHLRGRIDAATVLVGLGVS